MEDIRRRCNPIVEFSKFIFNEKILSKVITLGYNQFYSYTLSFLSPYISLINFIFLPLSSLVSRLSTPTMWLHTIYDYIKKRNRTFLAFEQVYSHNLLLLLFFPLLSTFVNFLLVFIWVFCSFRLYQNTQFLLFSRVFFIFLLLC